MKFISNCVYLLNLGLTKLLFRVEAVGLENIPDTNVVFTPNHASYLDAFAICGAIPKRILDNTQWAGWTGIAFANPFNSFMSRLIQAIPIDAKKALVSSLALGSAVLKHKRNLVWFPEGERTLDGKLLPFRPGIGMLLEKSDVLVVPMYLKGTREALPPGKFLIQPVKVRVAFGAPVSPQQLFEEGAGERSSERIANALHDRVQSLGQERKTGKAAA
jgi:long-chain acyl-CoA synthetase